MIDERQRLLAGFTGDGDIAQVLPWAQHDGHVAVEHIAADASLVARVEAHGPLERGSIEKALPPHWPRAWLDQHGPRMEPHLEPGERVVHQAVQLIEVPRTEITYGLGDRVQTIMLEGRRMLAPPHADDTLLHERAQRLRILRYLLVAIPVAAGLVYLARGAYFASAAVALAVTCLWLVGAAAFRAVRSAPFERRRARAWVGMAGVALAAAAAFAVAAEPSVDRARALVRAGDHEAARHELRALGDEAAPGLAPIWADMYLAEALASEDIGAIQRLAERIAPGLPHRDQVLARVDDLAVRGASQALESRELDRARAMLAQAGERARARPEVKALSASLALHTGEQCRQRQDWACAFREAEVAGSLGGIEAAASLRSGTLDALRAEAEAQARAAQNAQSRPRRIQELERAVELWAAWASHAGAAEPREVARLRERIEVERKAEAEAQRLAEQQRAREEARRAREEERRRAQEERQRAREEQQRAREEQRRAREEEREQRQTWPRERSCCKVCTRGCACGDSCISCSKVCRKGPGCAC